MEAFWVGLLAEGCEGFESRSAFVINTGDKGHLSVLFELYKVVLQVKGVLFREGK